MKTKRTLDVLLQPGEISPDRIRGKTIVVIDVLRASTSLVTALANGAKLIIPCDTVEEAREIKKSNLYQNILLCGERSGKRISGFDLGNSPMCYTEDKVRDKTIVFTSTNGSRAINSVTDGSQIVIGGFINSQAVVDFISASSQDCLFACSGMEGRFSLEDTVCAGLMIEKIVEQAGEKDLQKTDEAFAAQILYRYHSNDLDSMIHNSQHGQYLQSIGFGDDLKVCINIDVRDMIPIFKKGVIIPL